MQWEDKCKYTNGNTVAKYRIKWLWLNMQLWLNFSLRAQFCVKVFIISIYQVCSKNAISLFLG